MDWLGSGLVGDALGFGSSLLGGIFGSNSASREADKAYMRQRELLNLQTENNMAFYEQRHQKEVGDLKAAGLNPLLSANSGSAPAVASSAPAVAKADKATSAAQLASAFSQMFIGMKNAESQRLNAEANSNSARANLINAETGQERFKFDSGAAFNLQKDYFGLEKQKTEPMVAGMKLDNAIKQIQADYAPLLAKADLDKKQADIAMAYLVGEAQAEFYVKSGNAALAQAAAQQSMAETARRLGISQELLNSQYGEKAIEEAKKIKAETYFKNREKGYLESLDQNDTYKFMKTWKYAFDDIPIFGNLGDYLKGSR